MAGTIHNHLCYDKGEFCIHGQCSMSNALMTTKLYFPPPRPAWCCARGSSKGWWQLARSTPERRIAAVRTRFALQRGIFHHRRIDPHYECICDWYCLLGDLGGDLPHAVPPDPSQTSCRAANRVASPDRKGLALPSSAVHRQRDSWIDRHPLDTHADIFRSITI